MEENRFENSRTIGSSSYTMNITCDYDRVPSSLQFIQSLGSFGIIFISLGTILMASTLYLSIDASYATITAKESKSVKRNVVLILFVYPVASMCSLIALAVPRAQLLSETVTQIFLTIILYRLYLLMIDVGLRDSKKSPSLRLRVGPCCCWPCLPFPQFEMNATNLSWLKVIVVQLPIVQTLVYCIFAFMSVENPLIVAKYGIFFQPLSITSILLGLYGLSITVMTLQEANPDSNVRHKAVVVQLVLLFSKLQGFIIKALALTGLFPCNPPITPQIYANFTYNALMLIEMLFLGYAARLVYGENLDAHQCPGHCGFAAVAETRTNVSTDNGIAESGTRNATKTAEGTRIELDRNNRVSNNNEISTTTGHNLSLNIRLASVTA